MARLGPTPTELLSAADGLLRDVHPDLAGAWPQAVAIHCRQALEGSMFDLWRAKAPGVEDASSRAQLPCLRSFVDPAIAECADETWTALSRACHHHAYELSPTAAELGTWTTRPTIGKGRRQTRRLTGPLIGLKSPGIC